MLGSRVHLSIRVGTTILDCAGMVDSIFKLCWHDPTISVEPKILDSNTNISYFRLTKFRPN